MLDHCIKPLPRQPTSLARGPKNSARRAAFADLLTPCNDQIRTLKIGNRPVDEWSAHRYCHRERLVVANCSHESVAMSWLLNEKRKNDLVK